MVKRIETENLVLRKLKLEDLFGYYEFKSDFDTMQLFGGRSIHYDKELQDFITFINEDSSKGNLLFWTITLKGMNEFIGFFRAIKYDSHLFGQSFYEVEKYAESTEFKISVDRKNGWEIDYALLPKFRGKGIMSEAADAILKYMLRDLYIKVIYAKVASIKNESSIKVLKKNLFTELFPVFNPREEFTKENIGMMFICKS